MLITVEGTDGSGKTSVRGDLNEKKKKTDTARVAKAVR